MTEAYNVNALPAGTMLQEYEVLRVVGEGSFGIVYLAKGKYLGDLVAIKEYLPRELATRAEDTSVTPTSSSSEKDFLWGLQKFLEEARLLWQLANPKPHPNIVAVRRFFELHATAYLVMNFEQGEPLSAVINRAGTLPERQIWSLLNPLLDGLETVHAAGITHRDIKPDNIFVRTDGTPVLLDFGAARLALGERTQSAFNAMSPAYAATEQLMGSDKIGPWTDIYGLGAMLYRAVTGQLPQPPLERLIEERHRTAIDLAGDRYSPTLLEGIDAAMSLRAEDRPHSIADWRALLLKQTADADERTTVIPRAAAAAAATPPVKAPPQERGVHRPKAEPRRRRSSAAVMTLGLLAALGLGGYFLASHFDFEMGFGPSDREIADAGPATEPEKKTVEAGPPTRPSDEPIRQKAEDTARHQAEAEARRLDAEETAREVEAEAARQAEAQAQRLAEEEARRQTEVESQRQAEAKAAREVEEESRRLAEEDTKRKAELKARWLADLEAQRQAELEAQRQAELEDQRQAELEAQRQAEEEARRLAEQVSIRKADETTRRLSQVVALEVVLFAAKNTNVRAAPSVDSSKLAMLSAGSGVRVTGRLQDGNWYRVSLANGTNGFVWAPLLTREPPPAAMRSGSEPDQSASLPAAVPQTPGGGTRPETAGGGVSTQKSGTEIQKTQEAVVRPVPNSAETRSRIAELERYIDQNWRDAERAFRDFVTRERILRLNDRFHRVISFDDISFEPPEYVISVLFAYCLKKASCVNLEDVGKFVARFDGEKLTFLGKVDAPAN
jgi:serine/threonine protein kinase